MFGIKDHDLRALDACKARECRFARIAARCGQDHDLVSRPVLPCRSRHQIGQNRERHVLERDRGTVEQLEIPRVAGLFQRNDQVVVEFTVVSAADACLELFFRIIGKKKAHDFVSHSPVIHRREFREVGIKRGDRSGNIESAVLRKTSQDRLRGCNRFAV